MHKHPSLSTFDPNFNLVTSWICKPRTLAYIRLFFAAAITAILIFCIVFQAVVLKNAQKFLSFFTNLSYFGLCGYFWASGIQTWKYSRSNYHRINGGQVYPLQAWPKFWQHLHLLLYVTVVTFRGSPYLVQLRLPF